MSSRLWVRPYLRTTLSHVVLVAVSSWPTLSSCQSAKFLSVVGGQLLVPQQWDPLFQDISLTGSAGVHAPLSWDAS